MGFFRTVYETCLGTAVFPRLLNVSLIRALFHFLLLAFLVTVFITACRMGELLPMLTKIYAEFVSDTGGIKVGSDGVSVRSKPDEKRRFILSKDFSFDYLPSQNTLTAAMIKDWKTKSGIMLMPKGLAYWKNDSVSGTHENYMLMDFEKAYVLTSDGFASFINGNYYLQPSEKFVIKNIFIRMMIPVFESNEKLLDFIRFSLVTVSFGFVFGIITLTAVAATTFFTAAQFMWTTGGPGIIRPTFKTTFVIVMYAAFPPLLIAAVFAGLDLPFLDFQTVFLTGFLIYHLIAYGRIQRFLNPPKRKDNDDEDEDIF